MITNFNVCIYIFFYYLLCYIISYYIISYYIIWYWIILYYIISYYVILCYIMLYYIINIYSTFYYTYIYIHLIRWSYLHMFLQAALKGLSTCSEDVWSPVVRKNAAREAKGQGMVKGKSSRQSCWFCFEQFETSLLG